MARALLHVHDCPMQPQPLSEKDLAEHIRQLEISSTDDRDELLTDLLVRVYPTKDTQNS